MYHINRKLSMLLALVMSVLLVLPVCAMELDVDPTSEFCFSADDFTSLAEDEGIFLTEVPSKNVASVYYGSRLLRAGDALPKEALNQLTLVSDCMTPQEVKLGYYTIANQKASHSKELKLTLMPKKNEPPVAQDSTLETYRNIANTSELKASDPENGTLTYTIVEAPKRGTVELSEDGAFTYTPEENKVGKDSFTFTVTDEAGSTSDPATVSILIKKPSEKTAYTDMANDPDAFEAMWLKEQGLFSGETIGGNLCFSPDATVSRGEFLVMVMNMVDAKAAEDNMRSGFADELNTPLWMQPYIVSALNNGMITGASSDNGVVFRPSASMTKAETAVMLQNILQLPTVESTAVFAPEEKAAIPVWAADAAAALSQAGLELQMDGEADPLTRRDAAKILYGVNALLENEAAKTFFWVQ